jgi:hypothetical protein
MPDVLSNTPPLEFAGLTKKQKRLVRKLAWESMEDEARVIVVVPWIIGCTGILIGILVGVFLGRLAFPNHLFRCFVIGLVAGTGIGSWLGWWWLERELQPYLKNIILENKSRILQIV